MPSVVVSALFKFGAFPKGDETTHMSYASLEGPEAPDMYTPREREGFAAPADERAPHAPDHHHHRRHARETNHAHPHHRPFDRAAAHHHRPHVKEPADAFLTPYDRRLTDTLLEKEPGRDWEPHMDPRGFVPHQTVKSALIHRGFSPEDASAITGNLIYESGGNQYPGHPVILNPPRGGQSGDAARGAAQWEKVGGRWEGLTSPSLDAQVEHIWNEMHGPEAASYAAMQRARTVAEKAHIVNTMYERPERPWASDRERIRAAEEAYRGRETPGIEHAAQKRLLGGTDTARIADIASGLAGKRVTSPEVQDFLSSAGRGHPSSLWCADYVSAALTKAGYASLPTRMATDYLRYGTPVAPGEARRGDVIVEGRHLTRPVPGHLGHVGIAAGPPQMHGGRMMIPEISGDYANRVEAQDWANPRTAQIRRPTRKAETKD